MKMVMKAALLAASTFAAAVGSTVAQAENDPKPIIVPLSGTVSYGAFGPGFGCNEGFVGGMCGDVFSFDLSAFSGAPAVKLDFDVRSIVFGPLTPVAGLLGTLLDSGLNAIASGTGDPQQFSVEVAPASTFADGLHRLVVLGSSPGAASTNFYSVGLSVQAVPEPQTYALMLAGVGLIGMAALRRRKQI